MSKSDVCAVIKRSMPVHDADFEIELTQSRIRPKLTDELLKIDEILERTIRPYLQSDGGDLEVLRLQGNELEVRYEGACGTCPSASAGTLAAIESILRDEYDAAITVYAVQ